MNDARPPVLTTHPRRTIARRQRTLLIATVIAGVFIFAAGVAAACIPWAGQVELQNMNDGALGPDGDENPTTVHGADHTDVEKDGSTGGDRGNGQGMVWCDVADVNGQQYRWAEVHPDGDGDADVRLSIPEVDHAAGETGNGCDSDVYLPEDTYTITYKEDSFDNHDDSTNANGEDTFADDRGASANGGSDEVVDATHCMDTDDDETDGQNDNQIEWNLIEEEDGSLGNDRFDEDDGPTNRFPADTETDDVVDEDHEIDVDLDQFNPDYKESGYEHANGDSDTDGHAEAAGLCITSLDEYYHDNDNMDDDDSEVVGDECPDAPECTGDKDGVEIEYGNAIPINILSSV